MHNIAMQNKFIFVYCCLGMVMDSATPLKALGIPPQKKHGTPPRKKQRHNNSIRVGDLFSGWTNLGFRVDFRDVVFFFCEASEHISTQGSTRNLNRIGPHQCWERDCRSPLTFCREPISPVDSLGLPRVAQWEHGEGSECAVSFWP